MKKIIIVFILFIISSFLFSDNKEIYLKLIEENKFDELIVHLNQWEKSEPENPEVYIGYFNYYIRKGSESGVSFDKKPKDNKKTIAIVDPKTGEAVAYLNDATFYNIEEMTKAFEYINKGLEFSPDRLDMHFGKIHLLNEIKDYKNASKSLMKVLELSISNNNKWLWSDNQKLDDGQNIFIENAQDYYEVWFNADTKESLEAIKDSSMVQVKLYPKHIFAYNNLASYYAIKKQYNKALEYSLEAEKINPKDTIVLNNIAIIFRYMNNKEQAKKYFEKIIEYGNEDEKEYARGMIKDL